MIGVRVGRAAQTEARADEAEHDRDLEHERHRDHEDAAGRRVRDGRGQEARCQAGGSCVGGHRSVLRGVDRSYVPQAARVASANPRLAIGEFEGLHGLACARADGRIGLPQLAAEASPSRHDRRSSARAGGSAIDPAYRDPRPAHHGRLRRCCPRGRDLPVGVATPLRGPHHRRGPAGVRGERRGGWPCS